MKVEKKKHSVDKNSNSYYKKGSLNGYTATINYNEAHNTYYYGVAKGPYLYTSSWDSIYFETEAECIKACEEHIKEVSNG